MEKSFPQEIATSTGFPPEVFPSPELQKNEGEKRKRKNGKAHGHVRKILQDITLLFMLTRQHNPTSQSA